MGSLVMASKATHVPSIWLSMYVDKHRGIRKQAEDGLRELGSRALAREVDTFVVCDTHWLNRVGFHVNGNARHASTFSSHEVPHMLNEMPYDYPGDPELAALIVEEANAAGLKSYMHQFPSLGLDYGTLMPMHLAHDKERGARVVSVGASMHSSIGENLRFGAAIARAAARSDRRVAFIASGSLSHQFPANEVAMEFLNEISSPINKHMDHAVLQLWTHGRIDEFLAMLPEYDARFSGEGAMADTAMLFGTLGGAEYQGSGEELCDYFPSTGTGQAIVDFNLTV